MISARRKNRGDSRRISRIENDISKVRFGRMPPFSNAIT
jgi:hypothetical protein